MKPTKKLQKAILAGDTVLITFYKKDGSLRKARVTRNLKLIPVDKHPKRQTSINFESDLINVYDLGKGDWICFYQSKIVEVVTYPTKAQELRRQKARERWQLVKRIVSNYLVSIGEALSIASGKIIDGLSLSNISI